MIAIPAIDLRDGCCVQLVGGSFADERVRLPDPLAVARRWVDAGFRHLHVVDLDAAMGVGANLTIVENIASLTGIQVQVGGGIRSDDSVERLLNAGAARVVVGTRALQDRAWLGELGVRWPDRVVVAADVRAGRVVTNGWTAPTNDTASNTIRELDTLPLAGFLVTAVDREGRLAGPDLELIGDAAAATSRSVIASGGIASHDDIRALAACGATAAVIGMALYSGALDPRAVAQEFNQ